VAVVVVLAIFGALIGFGGNSKSPKPAADSRPSTPSATTTASATAGPTPTSSTPTTTTPSSTPTTKSAAPTTSPATPRPSVKPSPKPSSTSTGIGTQDGSIASLNQKVRNQPVRIRIPSLGVDAGVLPVGVDTKGALQVPSNVIQAAWYQAGAAPGDAGTAIVAAHVDFNGALGLFNQLHTLKPGAEIDVVDASGKVRVFHATTGKLAPKNDPSTVQSLAAASTVKGRPSLALITCGGDLDTVKHSYYDNYVLLADA
jgi:sortase (surface protein transpeptidase)